MSEYISGSCNIGPAEIKRRRQGAVFGGALYLISAIVLVASGASTTLRLITFLPAILFAVGLIQTRRKFCVAYGFMGVFSFEKLGATKKITINQDLAADRKYAVKLLIQSIFIALLLAGLVVLI